MCCSNSLVQSFIMGTAMQDILSLVCCCFFFTLKFHLMEEFEEIAYFHSENDFSYKLLCKK